MNVFGIGVLTLLATVVWSVPAGVSESRAPEPGADRAKQFEQFRQNLEDTRRRLNLTDEQVDQIRPILRSGFQAMLEVFQKHGIEPGEHSGTTDRIGFLQLRRLRRDLDAVRKQTLKHLDGVLTDTQLKTYKQIQEEHRKALRERLRQRRR